MKNEVRLGKRKTEADKKNGNSDFLSFAAEVRERSEKPKTNFVKFRRNFHFRNLIQQ